LTSKKKIGVRQLKHQQKPAPSRFFYVYAKPPMLKRLLLAALLLPGIANAQFVNGQVLTATQLNNQFSLYVPLAGGTLTGPLTVPSLSVTGTPISLASGGTGATTQSAALTAILGSSIVPVSNGGTGHAGPVTVVANCVGTGDDSVAINAAITSAGGGSRVTIPTGETCRIANPIVVGATNLELDGQGATILAATGATYGIQVTGNYNVIRNFTVNANSIANVGILVTGNHNKVDRNVAYGAVNHGIALDGSSTACNYNEVTRNESSGNAMIGISNWKCDYGRIINNYSHDNSDEGITYDYSSYGVIANNAVIHNTGGTGGIGVDRTVYTSITGNLIKDNTVAGIAVNNQVGTSDHGAITGNTFVNNGTTAHVYFHTCTGAGTPIAACTGAYQTVAWAASGNTMDSLAKAVVIDAGSNNNNVTGNTFSGASNYTDNGSSDHFTANDITGAPGQLLNVQVLTSTGTYTPTSGTGSVIVELQADGGGGGGTAATSTGQSAAAGGGGAGSYAKVRLTSGFSGVTVTLPSGGAGATAGNNGGTAGTTASFGSLISCPGGNAGAGSAASSSALITNAGAVGSACTVSSGTTLTNIPGSGGRVGVVLVPGTYSYSGAGGLPAIAPSVIHDKTSSSGGIGATAPGMGGGGANQAAASGSANAGGAGGNAEAIVWEYQ
jgi:hypothetical protein